MEKQVAINKIRKSKKPVTVVLPKMECKHCTHTWHPRFRVVRRCPKCKTTYFDCTKDEVWAKRQALTKDLAEKDNYNHIKFVGK